MDNGFPLTTEPNILKEMIPPPSMLNRVVNSVTGGTGYDLWAHARSKHTPTPSLGPCPALTWPMPSLRPPGLPRCT